MKTAAVLTGFNNARSAFTMMEIMTVMAIISVFASITVPALNNFNSGTRVKASAEVFVQNIRMAKYRAMSEQGVHRLIFSSDKMYYKIQSYVGDSDLNMGLSSSTAGIDFLYDTNHDASYSSFKWETIADTEEIEIDPGIEIRFDGTFPKVLYFWPSGTLVQHDTGTDAHKLNGLQQPIGEIVVSFIYGSAAIRVMVNALGVFSSESYAADEDTDMTNDEVLW